ncbi:hypothetical protein SK128_005475 [Halocaridina rubra]|uniref:Uncharacterized protein n=1 Tax=Halocaridina rubra TaxID=373956 RepID=A0AAN9AH41_HALRR
MQEVILDLERIREEGGKQHSQNSLVPNYRNHISTGDASWHQHHHSNRQKASWTASVDRQRETNDIPNTLPGSLYERERLNRDDFADNRVDSSRHSDIYSVAQNRDVPQQSNEEEINNEVQDYDSDIELDPQHTNWQTGGWSMCSRECGSGEKRRQVVCFGSKELCRPEDRPVDRMTCNNHLCAEWSTGDWGHCRIRRRRCGRGKQERLVMCRDPNGPVLDERHCHAADKPTHSRPCKVACSNKRRGRRQRYKWKTGEWSPVKYRRHPLPQKSPHYSKHESNSRNRHTQNNIKLRISNNIRYKKFKYIDEIQSESHSEHPS